MPSNSGQPVKQQAKKQLDNTDKKPLATKSILTLVFLAVGVIIIVIIAIIAIVNAPKRPTLTRQEILDQLQEITDDNLRIANERVQLSSMNSQCEYMEENYIRNTTDVDCDKVIKHYDELEQQSVDNQQKENELHEMLQELQ